MNEENLSRYRQMNREWIKANRDLIQLYLQKSLVETKKRMDELYAKSDVEIFALVRYQVDDNNPYSSSICALAIQDFPAEKLANGMKMNYVNVEGTFIDKLGRSKKDKVDHFVWTYGHFIIDPTFGQFVNLDEAIARNPQLFEERVLVATADEAMKNFGIKYDFSESKTK